MSTESSITHPDTITPALRREEESPVKDGKSQERDLIPYIIEKDYAGTTNLGELETNEEGDKVSPQESILRPGIDLANG
jgi:hypothetical protein